MAEPLSASLRRDLGTIESYAGTAAKPLQHPADCDRHVPPHDIDGDDAGRLEDVEDERRADLAAAPRNRFDVDHVRRLEKNVSDRNDLCPFVDCLKEALEVEAEARGIVRHRDDLRPRGRARRS